jgi:hypothetical protein
LLIQTSRNNHPIRKWWKSIFAEILDISLTNSYTIFRVRDPGIIHKDFRIEIVKHFESTYNNNGSKTGRKKGLLLGISKLTSYLLI